MECLKATEILSSGSTGTDLDHVTCGLWRTKIFLNFSKSFKVAKVLVLILILIQIWRTRKSFLNPPLSIYYRNNKYKYCINKHSPFNLNHRLSDIDRNPEAKFYILNTSVARVLLENFTSWSFAQCHIACVKDWQMTSGENGLL